MPNVMAALPNIHGGPRNVAPLFLYALTFPNINCFSKFFHYQNQEKIVIIHHVSKTSHLWLAITLMQVNGF